MWLNFNPVKSNHPKNNTWKIFSIKKRKETLTMKITLNHVRQVLKEAFGYNSFIASFIKDIHEDKNHLTVGITKEGIVCYNPEFVSKYIKCKEDLFSLIFHELLHPMFGHFIYECGIIENIAADAVINAAISILYPIESLEGALFKNTHSPRGLDGLLRPMSNMGNSRYKRVYERLYQQYKTYDTQMTTGELIQTLKILTPKENLSKIILIGTYKSCSNGNEFPTEVLTKIAGEIKLSVREKASNQAGYFQNIVSIIMDTLKTYRSIRRSILSKFATKRKFDKFIELFQNRRISTSPVPIYPSKRDIVLLAVGTYPCYFHNKIFNHQKRHKGLVIYLDVSGSVNHYLPKILGILKNLKKEITTIFQFSNKVVETSFSELIKGNIQTTYGTDFNCIAKSIIEKGFDKAIIITDGYASMNNNLKQQLMEHKLSTLTILFDNAPECDVFKQFGEVVHLEDICN